MRTGKEKGGRERVRISLSKISWRCIVVRRLRVLISSERCPLYSLSAFFSTLVDSSEIQREMIKIMFFLEPRI